MTFGSDRTTSSGRTSRTKSKNKSKRRNRNRELKYQLDAFQEDEKETSKPKIVPASLPTIVPPALEKDLHPVIVDGFVFIESETPNC